MGKYDHIDFSKEIPFIRKRCPHLNEEELKEAEELFRDYIRLCLEIHERKEMMEINGSLTEN
ncbi:MAG: hypothetical protein PHV97_07360 [Candidatus Omnitrophica bacterium]|nr:hypothetical protein [Candidatus Omnitrophota bacterium]